MHTQVLNHLPAAYFLLLLLKQKRTDMHPSPVGTVNDPTVLLPGARGIVNNYASAHMRQLAYYALSFDAADDPVVDPIMPQV